MLDTAHARRKREPPPTGAVPDRPCPPWRRLLALVYDLLAVLALVMVVGLLAEIATGGQLIATGAQVAIPAWYRPLQGLVVAGYFAASWRYGGQTLGMRPWRVRLVAADGNPVDWQQILVRLAAAGAPVTLLWLAPALGARTAVIAVGVAWTLWFAVALFDPRRRALHDIAADTELRRIA